MKCAKGESAHRAPQHAVGGGALSSPPEVVAVLTSYNRREQTLKSLAALQSAANRAGARLSAVLVDDASTDGTAQAVGDTHPWVDVLQGSGYLFWNGGMAMAMQAARQRRCDFLLWLNDDTLLFPDSLERLLRECIQLSDRFGQPVTMVGSTRDATGRLSYGGSRRVSNLRRFQYRKVWDPEAPIPCEAMNGNCVLIPQEVWRRVGDIDPTFAHAMGDVDYALRIRAQGLPLYVGSGFVGACSNNPVGGTFNDRSLSFERRWQLMMAPKGLPWRSWLRFTRKHGGLAWPIYFGWPYVRLMASGLLQCLRQPMR